MSQTTAGKKENPEPFGFLVLIFEHGRWSDCWGGDYYVTRQEAELNVREARARGFRARVVELVPLPDESDEGVDPLILGSTPRFHLTGSKT